MQRRREKVPEWLLLHVSPWLSSFYRILVLCWWHLHKSVPAALVCSRTVTGSNQESPKVGHPSKSTYTCLLISLNEVLINMRSSHHRDAMNRLDSRSRAGQNITTHVSRMGAHQHPIYRTSEARNSIRTCLLLIPCRLIICRCTGADFKLWPCRPTRILGATGTDHACVGVCRNTLRNHD
jgi:hypothetical protein